MACNTQAVWAAMLFIGMFAWSAIDPQVPPLHEASETTPALLRQTPDIVCLLADTVRWPVHSPIAACPSHEAA